MQPAYRKYDWAAFILFEINLLLTLLIALVFMLIGLPITIIFLI